MNCDQARDSFFDVLAPASQPEMPAGWAAHLQACQECARQLAALKQTMAAMDEWRSPDPSPYFDTRFEAHLAELKRDEAASSAGMFSWLRRPAFGMPAWRPLLGGVLALVLAVAAGLYSRPSPTPAANRQGSEVSAVNDLQKLDKNGDLYSDFELLDDLNTDNGKSGTAKPAGEKTEL